MPDLRRLLLAVLACCAFVGWAIVGVAGAGVARSEPIALTATPVPLDPVDPARVELGRLVYRGGLILQSSDARFGGWSDLRLAADGGRLTAISDHGFWLQARLVYDATGRLVALSEASLGPLIDTTGARLLGRKGDAEGLAAAPDGGFYVSFERIHRVWRYPRAEPPFSAPPRPLPMPPRLASAPDNGGIEALLRLSDGRMMALVEELRDGDENVGWVRDTAGWHELHYRAADDYKPTGLAQLPGSGDILVLERRFTFLTGMGARIVRVPKQALQPGAHLQGEELAALRLPFTVDNFEGLAVAQPGGTVRLYLISDDNYTVLQRTLLLMFELKLDK